MSQLPQRKNIRLKDYDYSSNGMYFITVCCNNKYNYLGKISCDENTTHKISDYHLTDCRGGVLLHPSSEYPIVQLTNIGQIVSEQWYELKNRYQTIGLDQFVIMPNHIHGIISIENDREEQSPSPTISDIICAYKSITTKLSNKSDQSRGRIIWQRGYYEHIIRNQQELQEIREYIVNNPAKWQLDKYYM